MQDCISQLSLLLTGDIDESDLILANRISVGLKWLLVIGTFICVSATVICVPRKVPIRIVRMFGFGNAAKEHESGRNM